MNKTTAEAWAKFIVSGEHAVLAGAPCLVYPLRQARLRIDVLPAATFGVSLNSEDLSTDRTQKIFAAARLAGWDEPQLHTSFFQIVSSIELGSGLGSSAALCVCLAKLSESNSTEEHVFQAALRAEGLFHGRSSGADPAGVSAGHPILYTMNDRRREDFHAAPSAPFSWVLRHSGSHRESLDVIATLAADPSRASARVRMNELARVIPDLIREGDWPSLPAAIESLSTTHRELGLVNEALELAFRRMKSEGAAATKLTGAGRGGYALGLYPREAVQKLQKSEIFVASFSGDDEDL